MSEFKSIEELKVAYNVLRQHAEALELEWRDSQIIQQVHELETDFLEEQTAKELGVAGSLLLGLSFLHSTLKALIPVKVAAPVVGGAWVLGGAFIVFRLTAGTVAGWVASTERNAKRKRILQQKLETIEDRIRLMVATQDAMLGHSASGSGGVIDSGAAAAAATQLQKETSSIKRISPTGSTGSSAEFIEAPVMEESANTTPQEEKKELESWRRYASLGRRK